METIGVFRMAKTIKILLQKSIGIAAGGAVGAVLRYAVCAAAASQIAAVAICNIAGSFVFSLAMELRRRRGAQLGNMVSAGFCGGISVFASFSKDSLDALKSGDYALFALNLSANFILCVAAANFAEKLLAYWLWRGHTARVARRMERLRR